MIKTIRVGKKNNIFQYVETLKNNRTKRYACKEIFVEGVDNINFAILNGWHVMHFIFSDYEKLSFWAKEKIENNSCENWSFAQELMEEISEKNNTSELIAIFKMKNIEIAKTEKPFVVLLDKPSKKGNLGTVIRSADALGADGIIVTGHSVDIFDPAVISASMGSFFKIPIIKMETNEQVLSFIESMKKRHDNFQIVATVVESTKLVHEIDFKKPTLLLVGNETVGLNNFYLNLSSEKAKIAMVNGVDSFNVACATSIVLYEVYKQRNFN